MSLSYCPLRIAAAEWVTYSESVYHNRIKEYEYSPDAVLSSLGHIESDRTSTYWHSCSFCGKGLEIKGAAGECCVNRNTVSVDK